MSMYKKMVFRIFFFLLNSVIFSFSLNANAEHDEAIFYNPGGNRFSCDYPKRFEHDPLFLKIRYQLLCERSHNHYSEAFSKLEKNFRDLFGSETTNQILGEKFNSMEESTLVRPWFEINYYDNSGAPYNCLQKFHTDENPFNNPDAAIFHEKLLCEFSHKESGYDHALEKVAEQFDREYGKGKANEVLTKQEDRFKDLIQGSFPSSPWLEKEYDAFASPINCAEVFNPKADQLDNKVNASFPKFYKQLLCERFHQQKRLANNYEKIEKAFIRIYGYKAKESLFDEDEYGISILGNNAPMLMKAVKAILFSGFVITIARMALGRSNYRGVIVAQIGYPDPELNPDLRLAPMQ